MPSSSTTSLSICLELMFSISSASIVKGEPDRTEMLRETVYGLLSSDRVASDETPPPTEAAFTGWPESASNEQHTTSTCTSTVPVGVVRFPRSLARFLLSPSPSACGWGCGWFTCLRKEVLFVLSCPEHDPLCIRFCCRWRNAHEPERREYTVSTSSCHGTAVVSKA